MKFFQIAKVVREQLKGKSLDEFINTFSPGYNSLLDQVSQIVNGNLTTKDNLKGQTIEFTKETGTTLGAGKKVSWTLNEAPTSLHIAQVVSLTGTALSTAPWLEWSYDSGSGSVTVAVKGLVGASTYFIRIRAAV